MIAIFLTDSHSCVIFMIEFKEAVMCNPVPVFEVKNKLPYFIHKAEDEGPVPITRNGKEVAYIISKSDLDEMKAEQPKKKSLVERLRDNWKKAGLDNDDFDFTAYLNSLRDHNYYGPAESEHLFDDFDVDDIKVKGGEK